MLTSSCGLAAAMYAAEIPATQLAGRWTSKAGTSLVFHEDHTFTSEHLSGRPFPQECSTASAIASGRWAFYVPERSAEMKGLLSADEAAAKGFVLALSAGKCTVDVYLFGDEDDPAMCPTDDADDGCPSDTYLHRTSKPGEPRRPQS
ncbi:hypothetical protein [Streptomyces crystallinus]|uniref:Uncharacterized protein n=1 Tax=Streptomyces crystallinus TaxID=68191 RepID=A0ABN1GI41_9ACTN